MTDDARCDVAISSRPRFEQMVISHLVHHCNLYIAYSQSIFESTNIWAFTGLNCRTLDFTRFRSISLYYTFYNVTFVMLSWLVKRLI